MPPPAGTTYWISRYVWDTTSDSFDYWRLPDGAIGGLNLRAIGMAGGSKVNPEGFCFAALGPGAPTPSGGIVLASSLSDALSAGVKTNLAAALGVTVGDIDAPDLLGILWNVLTTAADPTGVARVKPLMPGVDGQLKLHLGGHSLIKQERFDRTQHPFVLDVLKQNAARLRDEVAINRDPVLWRKYLGSIEEKYGYRADEVIPGAVAIKPETTHTEAFTGADSATLGYDLTWTDIGGDMQNFSNQARASNIGHNVSRAEADVSTDDHYALMDFTDDASGTQAAYIHARFDSAAENCYRAYLRPDALNYRLYEATTGTYTQIGSTTSEAFPTLPFEAKLEVDGSSVELFINGTSKVGPVTDTTHTGYTRGGLGGLRSSGNRAFMDNYEITDLGAPPPSTLIRRDLMLMGVGR